MGGNIVVFIFFELTESHLFTCVISETVLVLVMSSLDSVGGPFVVMDMFGHKINDHVFFNKMPS